MDQYQQNIDLQSDKEKEVFSIAKSILENKIDILMGSRLLSGYLFKADCIQEELLLNAPGFDGIPSILVARWLNQQVEAYELDGEGNPVNTTERSSWMN